MFNSLVRTKASAGILIPTLRRNISHHTTAQAGKAKGLIGPLAITASASFFVYGLVVLGLPTRSKQE
ncbi:hypothetical protein K7432_003916 [Basidiobolus ranarum]|uniref:Uncharacterized protein n=1 Tax=Basidiobolus ranarum TaxID=34480 RepID=A0ABR2W5G4_9FUNG